MRKLIFFFLLSINVLAQNSFKIIVKNEHSGEPLPGVTAQLLNSPLGASTNEEGFAEINNIPDGVNIIRIFSIGYIEKIIQINFPLPAIETYNIQLQETSEEFEEVSISATRSSRLINDEPTRVEVVAGEEIDEKISMDPSNISMILNESTGIQVQQNSSVSLNSSFRIQGLDGRYTQLLRDGFPLYSGYSGSLSINQIPPLDLRQVEIIKGSSSTLYGGGAIAGLINLVSKEPADKNEISFLLNGTSAGGIDLSGYYSEKFSNVAISIFASRNSQSSYDNNEDKFTDLPETDRYSFNPKFYFTIDENNTLQAGGSFISEDMTGGYITAIERTIDSGFTEKNKSRRFSSQLRFDSKTGEGKNLTFKNSFGLFDREILIPSYSFKGKQLSSYSELSYSVIETGVEWIFGLNFITEKFTDIGTSSLNLGFSETTLGGFFQNTVNLADDIMLESGFRIDYNKNYGWFALPRISMLIKMNHGLTLRAGGGLGYKLPSIFMEETEKIYFRNLLPVKFNGLNAEKSYGLNLDINYRTVFSDIITISLNNLFFYTRINDPVILSNPDPAGLYSLSTFEGHYDTHGFETNLKLTYHDYKLFVGYTYTNAGEHTGNVENDFLLTPKNKLGIVLIYEEHENFRIGLEGYYTGNQKLITGETTKDYWITGLMAEKKLGNISLFINFENFLDTKQSNYGPVYSGSVSNPFFNEIYAPTDGSIINGGIKIKF